MLRKLTLSIAQEKFLCDGMTSARFDDKYLLSARIGLHMSIPVEEVADWKRFVLHIPVRSTRDYVTSDAIYRKFCELEAK